MKIIKHLVEDIREELEGAEHYAKLATQYRDEDRGLADAYSKLAEAELGHVDALHAQVVRLIQEYKASNKGPVPAAMQAVWDWEHERMIDTITRVRALLSTYKTAR